MLAKPRSLPPIESTTSFTFAVCATYSSWSPWVDSFLNGSPPLLARKMFAVVAPEQARLIFSSTAIVALLISATSERSQPLRALRP
jgi:hypothetical protein